MKRFLFGLILSSTLLAQQPGRQSFPGLMFCEQKAGTTDSAKMNRCILDLAWTGGLADATGMIGPHTFSTDMFSGVAATTKPGVVQLGAGTYTITAAQNIPSNWTVRGLGIGITTVNVVASASDNDLAGWGIKGNNITVRDMTINLTKNTSTVRAFQFNAASSNVLIEHNDINGVGGSLGATSAAFGVDFNGFNVSQLRVLNNRFNNVAWAAIMDNSDTSNVYDTVFDGNLVINSSEGFNPNHPSSTGYWKKIKITNNHFQAMTSWGVGLSGVGITDAVVANNTFDDVRVENIHIEDSASELRLIGNSFTNAGNSTVNGVIHIISNAKNITIAGNTCNLTTNTASATNCIQIQSGGGSAAPTMLTITGNVFLTKSGFTAIATGGVAGLVISDNIFNNPDTASKAAYAISVAGNSQTNGTGNIFYNPGASLVFTDNGSAGVISKSRIDGDLTGWTSFLSGNTNGSTSIVFDGFTIQRSYGVDVSGTLRNPLFPTPSLMDGRMGVRYFKNGVNSTFVTTLGIKYDGSNLSVEDNNQISLASDTVGFAVVNSGGNITGASFRAVAATGTITVTCDCVYVP